MEGASKGDWIQLCPPERDQHHDRGDRLAVPAWFFHDPTPVLFLLPKSPSQVYRAGGSLRAPAQVPSDSS